MRIRTKLLVLIFIPLLAVTLAAGFGFSSQSAAIETAEESAVVVRQTNALHRAVLAVGAERLALAGGDLGDRTEVTDATDAAVADLARVGLGTESTQAATDLESVRAVSGTPAFEAYGSLIAELFELETGTAEDYPDPTSRDAAIVNRLAIQSLELREQAWIAYLTGGQDVSEAIANEAVTDQPVTSELASDLVARFARADATTDTMVDLADSDRIDEFLRTPAGRSLEDLQIVAANDLRQQRMDLDPRVVTVALVDFRTGWTDIVDTRDAALGASIDQVLADENGLRSLFTLLGLVGLVALAGLIFVIYRSITNPLAALLDRANAVATVELPNLVHTLRYTDRAEDMPIAVPIEVTSSDEIGELVAAFNDVQMTAYSLATEQALGRRQVAEMFVNLGRRNQQLLQRILGKLTELEHNEEDPDTLADLFELDNVVTRMRRNAESLLVLAGAQTPRQWSQPVEIENTIRAAFGEVEGYQRIEIAALAPVRVRGNVVSDIAHLLAELLENSLKFSEGTQAVLVNGQHERGGYLVTIFDQGIGMTTSELLENNSRITDPPPLDQVPTKFLGLYVVGRLAERHNIEVRLSEAPGRGLMARIQLPAEILLSDDQTPEVELESPEFRAAIATVSTTGTDDAMSEDVSPLGHFHDPDAELASIVGPSEQERQLLSSALAPPPPSSPAVAAVLPVRGGPATAVEEPQPVAEPTPPLLPTRTPTAATVPTAPLDPMVEDPAPALPSRRRGESLQSPAMPGPAPIEQRESTDNSESSAGAFSSMMSALSSGISRGIRDSETPNQGSDT